jgi:hypothetical protein
VAQQFKDFKTSFYSRFDDLSLFDCQDFNILKVVLDGLKVDYHKKGISNNEIARSLGLYKFLSSLKRIKQWRKYGLAKAALERLSGNDSSYLFFDIGRLALNELNEEVSYYFDKIAKTLKQSNCFTIFQGKQTLPYGASINEFLALSYESLSKDEEILFSDLRASYQKIEKAQKFDRVELDNIGVAITLFFNMYRVWQRILSKTKFKACFFDQHYHREGFILALKRAGIKSIELQHGLIAEEDIFYIFPKTVSTVAHKAMFPDRLLTYGTYWSDLLNRGHEFTKDQIDVIGQYQAINLIVSNDDEVKINQFSSGKKIILVTTQTFLHSYFIEYVHWLSKDLLSRKSACVIVIKLHPSERIGDYASLTNLENVLVINCNTEYLLSKCDFHVSIYSTTLYDALKYKCMNFSLNVEQCNDYVEKFIKDGISNLLELDQNPIDMNVELIHKDFHFFYDDFNSPKHKLISIAS